MVTMSVAIRSWFRIMNTAMAITSTGSAVAASLPVGVSPSSADTVRPSQPATAPATTKIRIAATTFGR